jgi:ketosteroid isomerase-like protein
VTSRILVVLAAAAALSGCGSFFTQQDDAPARIEAALQAWAKTEGKEMRGGSLQIFGPSALQNGTFKQKTRLPDGKVLETQGTFEAEWDRQPDGSWLVARMTINPPPFTPTDAGSVP